jgi:hypothetical protein
MANSPAPTGSTPRSRSVSFDIAAVIVLATALIGAAMFRVATTGSATNLDLCSFTLSMEDMTTIAALGRPDSPRYGRLWGGDPATEER